MLSGTVKLFFSKKLTQQEIVEGCLKGDRSCQSMLYYQTSKQMLALCQRYFKDNVMAEDIMQEGYLKVFTCMESFRGDGSLTSWIRRIMVTACLSEIRKQKLDFDDDVIIENSQEHSYDSIDGNIGARELLKMIQSLPDGYRTVFNLYAIEGYSHQEIGDLLGISAGTSKSQLSRARQLLKDKLTVSKNYQELTYAL